MRGGASPLSAFLLATLTRKFPSEYRPTISKRAKRHFKKAQPEKH